MRVIHWNMRYFPLLGGIETHVDTLIRHTPDVEYEIITDALPETPVIERYRPNATIHRFLPVDRSRQSRHRKLSVPIAAFRDALREARQRKYLRKARYDVLHVHDFEKNLLLMEDVTRLRLFGKLARKLHGMRDLASPGLLTKHFMFTEQNASPALRRWEEDLVAEFDTVVCVDKPIQRRFESLGWSKRILFIPNPIDTEQFSPAPLPEKDVLRIGYVGRLAMARGESLLLELAHNLPEGTKLSMAVQHPGDRLRDVMRSLEGTPTKLELDVPHERMPQFLRDIHVLVNPITDTYSTTRVTLEAMSVGRPAIMFNSGERYPIRDGENGFLVNPNVKSVCRLIEELKADSKRLESTSKRAREAIEKEFAAPLVAAQIRKLYEELTGDDRAI